MVFMYSKAADVAGFYVNKHNDTIKAKLKIPYFPNISLEPNFMKMQDGIEYYVGVEKQPLTPDNCNAFGFTYTDDEFNIDTVVFVAKVLTQKSLLSGNDSSLLFLRVLVKGKLSLYRYYSTGSVTMAGPTMSSVLVPEEKSILEKNNGSLFMYNSFRFKTDMAGYLSDCPAVIKLMEEKKYKSKHLITIVNAYNNMCGK